MPRTFDSTLRWSGVSDVVTIGTSSAQSAAFGGDTFEIRVVSDTDCWINIGADPTAAATTDNNLFLPANVVEYFHVSPGQKLAVIQDSAAGNLCVAEMTR